MSYETKNYSSSTSTFLVPHILSSSSLSPSSSASSYTSSLLSTPSLSVSLGISEGWNILTPPVFHPFYLKIESKGNHQNPLPVSSLPSHLLQFILTYVNSHSPHDDSISVYHSLLSLFPSTTVTSYTLPSSAHLAYHDDSTYCDSFYPLNEWTRQMILFPPSDIKLQWQIGLEWIDEMGVRRILGKEQENKIFVKHVQSTQLSFDDILQISIPPNGKVFLTVPFELFYCLSLFYGNDRFILMVKIIQQYHLRNINGVGLCSVDHNDQQADTLRFRDFECRSEYWKKEYHLSTIRQKHFLCKYNQSVFMDFIPSYSIHSHSVSIVEPFLPPTFPIEIIRLILTYHSPYYSSNYYFFSTIRKSPYLESLRSDWRTWCSPSLEKDDKEYRRVNMMSRAKAWGFAHSSYHPHCLFYSVILHPFMMAQLPSNLLIIRKSQRVFLHSMDKDREDHDDKGDIRRDPIDRWDYNANYDIHNENKSFNVSTDLRMDGHITPPFPSSSEDRQTILIETLRIVPSNDGSIDLRNMQRTHDDIIGRKYILFISSDDPVNTFVYPRFQPLLAVRDTTAAECYDIEKKFADWQNIFCSNKKD